MKMMKPRSSILLLVIMSLMLSACDWQYNALSNSIPIEGEDTGSKRTIHVYIGVDGVSYYTLEKALAQGAFSGAKWKPSKYISSFPASSAYVWSRIMHASKIPSYDYQYYDKKQDKLINQGSLAVIEHGNPFHYLPVYKAFNDVGNGYSTKYLTYRQREISFDVRLDSIFIKLAGVSETSDVFTAYVAETDARAHMDNEQEVVEMLRQLSAKIEDFKNSHKDKEYLFTLFSDHGNDYIPVSDSKMIEFDKEMEKLNITPVQSLNKYDPNEALYALPIVHTRVTSFTIYTHKQNEEEVAKRMSSLEAAELVISPSSKPQNFQSETETNWYAVWKDGARLFHFGFDDVNDQYILTYADNFQDLGLEIPFASSDDFQRLSDDVLFDALKHSAYPDLFYRTRTALESVGIEYPANVIISCEPGFASAGFKFPGGTTKVASKSFHGSLGAAGSVGILLSEEDNVPDATRSDTLIELFPSLKTYVREMRKLEMDSGDKNSGLSYLDKVSAQ